MTFVGETQTPRPAFRIVWMKVAFVLFVLCVVAVMLFQLRLVQRERAQEQFVADAQSALYSDTSWTWGCFGDGQYPCIVNTDRSMRIVQVPNPLSYRIGRPGTGIRESLTVEPCRKSRCDIDPGEQFGAMLYVRAAYLFDQVKLPQR